MYFFPHLTIYGRRIERGIRAILHILELKYGAAGVCISVEIIGVRRFSNLPRPQERVLVMLVGEVVWSKRCDRQPCS